MSSFNMPIVPFQIGYASFLLSDAPERLLQSMDDIYVEAEAQKRKKRSILRDAEHSHIKRKLNNE